jgi:hypothetical protein
MCSFAKAGELTKLMLSVCVLTRSPKVRVFANDEVLTHRPVLSPLLEAALKIRLKFSVPSSPARCHFQR